MSKHGDNNNGRTGARSHPYLKLVYSNEFEGELGALTSLSTDTSSNRSNFRDGSNLGSSERRAAHADQRADLIESEVGNRVALDLTPTWTRKTDYRESQSGTIPETEVLEQFLARYPTLAPHQLHDPSSTTGKLVALLNAACLSGKVPRSPRNFGIINRAHFAKGCGISVARIRSKANVFVAYEEILESVEPASALATLPRFGGVVDSHKELDVAAAHVVSAYPALYKHQHYPPGTAATIVEMLNLQLVDGGLRRSRGGKISRQVIAQGLGFSETAMANYISIFADYEDAVGAKESVTEGKIPAMRAWFEQQMRDGTLELRDGKASRIQFYAAFNLPSSKTALIRYPRLGALVEEVDETIRSSGYLPKDTIESVAQLQEYLGGSPLINTDGITINRKAIIELLGINFHQIAVAPYADIIAAAEAQLMEQLASDPLTILALGRQFRFHELLDDGWPEIIAQGIAKCFARVYAAGKKSEAKSHYLTILPFLKFVASRKNSTLWIGVTLGQLFETGGGGLLQGAYNRALIEYRDLLGASTPNRGSLNTKLFALNNMLRHLAADGIFPTLELPMIQFREDKRTHLRSVAEVTPEAVKARENPHLDAYLDFATMRLAEAARDSNIEIATADQSEFAKVLRQDLETVEADSNDGPAVLVWKLLDRRLSLIEKAAQAVVEAAQTALVRGRELLQMAQDYRDDFPRLFDGSLTRPQRTQLLRQMFPKDDNNMQGPANLLYIVAENYGSLYPSNFASGRAEGQFFAKRALEYEGLKTLQSFLIPSTEAVCAALTLYLIQSGANLAVGRTLNVDCVEPAEEPRHSKITGFKARAKGKPIFTVLENGSEAVSALKWIAEALAPVRERAGDVRDLLFVRRVQGEAITALTEHTFREHFKRLVGSIPAIADLPLTPNMLRPSVLLKAALGADGRTQLSAAIGQHGRNVHEGYVNKYPVRLIRDGHIREFTTHLETKIISRIDDAHKLLGVEVDEMAQRVETLMRSGVGTLCADRFGRPGNNGQECKSFDCWNSCPQLFVIAKKEEIAILQVWQHSLRSVEGEWVRDQPDRWERVWLPWLCFVDVVEKKMLNSFGQVWREAQAISTAIISSTNFIPMRLF